MKLTKEQVRYIDNKLSQKIKSIYTENPKLITNDYKCISAAIKESNIWKLLKAKALEINPYDTSFNMNPNFDFEKFGDRMDISCSVSPEHNSIITTKELNDYTSLTICEHKYNINIKVSILIDIPKFIYLDERSIKNDYLIEMSARNDLPKINTIEDLDNIATIYIDRLDKLVNDLINKNLDTYNNFVKELNKRTDKLAL